MQDKLQEELIPFALRHARQKARRRQQQDAEALTASGVTEGAADVGASELMLEATVSEEEAAELKAVLPVTRQFHRR